MTAAVTYIILSVLSHLFDGRKQLLNTKQQSKDVATQKIKLPTEPRMRKHFKKLFTFQQKADDLKSA